MVGVPEFGTPLFSSGCVVGLAPGPVAGDPVPACGVVAPLDSEVPVEPVAPVALVAAFVPVVPDCVSVLPATAPEGLAVVPLSVVPL